MNSGRCHATGCSNFLKATEKKIYLDGHIYCDKLCAAAHAKWLVETIPYLMPEK